MADNVLRYVPAPRFAHVAAVVEGKLYVWGGVRRDLPAVHDGPAKTAITSVVDVLDPQVKKNKKIIFVIIIVCWCGRLNKCRAGPPVASVLNFTLRSSYKSKIISMLFSEKAGLLIFKRSLGHA